MISMGKSGGVYGSGNTGLPQAFSGRKKTQNNQKSIFGAKNKSSVTDIRRMLARDDRNGQTQAANRLGQESIVTSTLSYSESLRNQRQQTKNTTLALKKLKYQFKSISSKILRSKTSQAAKQAAGQARREIMRLKRQKQNSDSDSDSEEIDAAIAHAQAMERVAKKKAKHLEEEEMMKAAGGICQGDRISEEETKDVPDAEAENARNAEEMSAEDSANEVSGDFSAYEYAGDSYDISDYVDLGMDEFYAQAGDFMSEMSDFTSEMMQEMSDSLRDLMEEMGLDGLSGREVMAAFPGELLQYVRQYSNVICMPYGRDIMVSKWTVQNDLYDVMEQEVIDAQELAELAREEACAYVILSEDKKLVGKMQDQEFEEFGRMHGYVIYKDSTVDLYYFMKE